MTILTDGPLAGTEKGERARRAAKAFASSLRHKMTVVDASPAMPERKQRWDKLERARGGLHVAVGKVADNGKSKDKDKDKDKGKGKPVPGRRKHMSRTEHAELVSQLTAFAASLRAEAAASGNAALGVLASDTDVLIEQVRAQRSSLVV